MKNDAIMRQGEEAELNDTSSCKKSIVMYKSCIYTHTGWTPVWDVF